jgi:Lanthionine synthetase C-like protein
MITTENIEKVIASLVKKAITQCSNPFPASVGQQLPLSPANSDNIAEGELGNIFLLLEVYRKTKDEEVWVSLQERLTLVENWCKQQATNNYTYFFGRCGLLSLYIHLYEQREEKPYLEKAVELANFFVSSSSMKFALLGNMSLYDGLGGMLMVFLKLYSLTADDFFLQVIERFTKKIIHSAKLSKEGVFWTNSCKNTHDFGFKFGASGIALAFLELGQFWSNDAFFELAKHALCYEDRYWSYDERRWQTTVCAKGSNEPQDVPCIDECSWHTMDEHSAMTYVRMKYDRITGTDFFESKWKAGMELVISKCFNESFADDKETIQAVSKTGIVLQELFNYTGDTRISEAILIITASVIRFLKLPDIQQQKDGLANIPGAAVYFLARQLVTNDKPAAAVNFLFTEYEPCFSGNIDIDSILIASSGELFEMMAERNFVLSYPALKLQAAAGLASFFQQPKKFTYGCIKREFKKLAEHNPENSRLRYLLDRDIFMQEIYDGFESSKYAIDEDVFIDESVKVVTLSDEELLDTKFTFCDNIWIQQIKPSINLSEIIDVDAIIEMLGGKEPALVIHSYSPAGVIVTEQVTEDRLFLEQFLQPATCREIINRLMKFIELQEEDVKTLMRLKFEAADNVFLKSLIGRALFSVIRYFVGEGILRRYESV